MPFLVTLGSLALVSEVLPVTDLLLFVRNRGRMFLNFSNSEEFVELSEGPDVWKPKNGSVRRACEH